jgi:hypothetical protein
LFDDDCLEKPLALAKKTGGAPQKFTLSSGASRRIYALVLATHALRAP